MTPNADQAIKLLRQLPLPEREKVRRWIQETNGNASNVAKGLNEMQGRFQRSMGWIDSNRQDYVGMWVALDGDELLAFGRDGKEVRAEASAKTDATPLMHLVTLSEIEPFAGFD